MANNIHTTSHDALKTRHEYMNYLEKVILK